MSSLLIFLKVNGPLLMQGAIMSLFLWLVSLLISLIVGTLLGVMQSKKLWVSYVSSVVSTITFVLRAVPFFVQLLIVYFVIPDLIGVSLSAVSAGIVALGICSSSYVCNIVRAGIDAIPQGQWEACQALGLSAGVTLRYIILPQMMRTMLPALINECVSVLKSTSIISSIGVLEMVRMGMNIVSREMNPLPIYCAIAVVYIIFAALVEGLRIVVERRFSIES